MYYSTYVARVLGVYVHKAVAPLSTYMYMYPYATLL